MRFPRQDSTADQIASVREFFPDHTEAARWLDSWHEEGQYERPISSVGYMDLMMTCRDRLYYDAQDAINTRLGRNPETGICSRVID